MTLQRWDSIRRGEEMNRFPDQANAALVSEIPVLSTFAKGLLAEASFASEGEDITSEHAQEA
jgi:hypothetical protein